jgi:hypothetical protein
LASSLQESLKGLNSMIADLGSPTLAPCGRQGEAKTSVLPAPNAPSMPVAPQAFPEPPAHKHTSAEKRGKEVKAGASAAARERSPGRLLLDMERVQKVLEDLLDKQTSTLEGVLRESVGELAGGFDTQAEKPSASPRPSASHHAPRQLAKCISSTGSVSVEPELSCSQSWHSVTAKERNENGLWTASYPTASSKFQLVHFTPLPEEAKDSAVEKAVSSVTSLDSEDELDRTRWSLQTDPFAFAKNCGVAEEYREGRVVKLSTTLREHILGLDSHGSWLKIEECLEWWDSLREPMRNRKIDRLVRSATFEWACLFVIFLNMVLVAYATDYEMRNHTSLRYTWVTVVEFIFSACYVVEIMLRLMSSGRFFFIGPSYVFNLFDLFLVVVTLFSQIAGTASTNWTFLRTLRLLRVAKVVRAVRLLHRLGLDELMLMLKCIIGSMSQLFWCAS